MGIRRVLSASDRQADHRSGERLRDRWRCRDRDGLRSRRRDRVCLVLASRGAQRFPRVRRWGHPGCTVATSGDRDGDPAVGGEIQCSAGSRVGLVNRVVPDGRSLSTALDLAYRIATSAPLAVQATKRLVAGIVDSTAVTEAEAWARNDREDAVVSETEDAKEGPRAFVEKRPPVWKRR